MMVRPRVCAAWWALVLVVAQPSPALAQDTARPAEVVRLESLLATASEHQASGRHAEAVAGYEGAAKLAESLETLRGHLPRVLFDLAGACVEAGEKTKGLAALDRLVQLIPFLRDDGRIVDVRTRLEALGEPATPTPKATGSTLGDALSELEHQVGLHRGVNEADAEALERLRRCLESASKGAPMNAAQKLRIERLARAAEEADPCTEEGRAKAEEFFTAAREVMCEHPEELEFLARRAKLAVQWHEQDMAWESGRLLAARGAEHAGDKPAVLESVIALQDAGYQRWSKTEADREATRMLALTLLQEARQAAAGIEEAYTKANTYREIAAAQAKAGDVEGVKAIFDTAKQVAAGIEDVDDKASTFCIIAETQAEAGDVEGAKKTAAGIELAADDPASDFLEVVAKPWAYRLIADVQAEAGDVEGAKTTLKTAMQTAAGIADHGGRIWAYRFIAEAQALVGDAAGAESTLETCQRDEKVIADVREATAMFEVFGELHPASLAAARGNDYSEATFETAKEAAAAMVDVSSRISSYLFIAKGQILSLNSSEARATLETAQQTVAQIGHSGKRARAYADIAVAQAQMGDVAGAEATIEIAERDEGAVVYASDRARASAFIAAAQAKAGDVAGAKATAAGIADAARKAWAYKDIASAQAKAGDVAAALATLDTARQSAAGIANAALKASVYRDIAAAQAEAGDVLGAAATRERAEQVESQAKRDRRKEVSDLDLIASRAAARDVEHVDLYNPDFDQRLRVVCAVAAAQARAGSFYAARETAKLISDPYNEGLVYRAIAAVQAGAGDIPGAAAQGRCSQDAHVRSLRLLGAAEGVLARAEDE